MFNQPIKCGTQFLTDTGAEDLILAAKHKNRLMSNTYNLFAAIGTPIKTYEETNHVLKRKKTSGH